MISSDYNKLLLNCFFNGVIALCFGKGINGVAFFADEGFLFVNSNFDLAEDIRCIFLDDLTVWLNEIGICSMSASKESDLLRVTWVYWAVRALDWSILKGESEDEGFVDKRFVIVAAPAVTVDGNFLEAETVTFPEFPSGEAYLRGEESSTFRVFMPSCDTPDCYLIRALRFVLIS